MKLWTVALSALTSISVSALVILMLVSATWAQSSDRAPGAQVTQHVCGPRDAAVAELVGDFEERVIGRGLSENGQAMLEVFKSESGSWTVIVTDTYGVSCVLANGQVWLQTQIQGDGYVYANSRK